MEHVWYSKVEYYTWEEMENLYHERLIQAANGKPVLTTLQISEALWDIVESIRYDNNGKSSDILYAWQIKYLNHLGGNLWELLPSNGCSS